jgi:hypothetical protein
MQFVVEMVSGGIIHTKIHDDRSEQFERLQCWYYWWEGFMT